MTVRTLYDGLSFMVEIQAATIIDRDVLSCSDDAIKNPFHYRGGSHA
jgi:hypothetical protein